MPHRIIITVTGPSMDEALRYAERADVIASLYPQHKFLLEYRLDMINRPDIRRLFRSSALGTIATNRHKAESGGKGGFDGPESERFRRLQEAVDSGANFVDAELDYFGQVTLGRAELIASHHNFQYTPTDMEDRVRQMKDIGASVAKIAVMPKTEDDNNSVLLLVEKMHSEIPTIGIAMGELGQRTRYQTPLVGGFATYACLDKEKAIAGQMTVDQLIEKWEKSKLTKPV